MSAIFISHSSKDNAIAAEIKVRLAEQGHRSVFLDFDPEDGIPAGRNWERELYAKLRTCQAVIVLCSEHSVTSQWCFAEITHARFLGKYLFPLRVTLCTIPSLLQDVQVVDLTVNPAEGYRRLWSGLQKAGLDLADLFDWDGSRPPYPGLLAFQEKDAAIYFGRDAAIQKAIETLNCLSRFGGPQLALVLGASGSGKSSLVRAGVVHRLRRDKDRWLVLEPFRPLGRPFDEMAMVFASAFNRFGHARDWKSIRDALYQAADNTGGARLLEMANDLRVASGQREASLLLIIDQFEELLGRDNDRSASRFLYLVRAVLDTTNSPFLALGTLRSDFLGEFQTHEAVRSLPYEPILLPPMAVTDFAQVIERPAKVAGFELEPGLAQAMVADTATDDALPLLAFTLRELWEDYGGDGYLTLKEYRDGLSGLQGSVARAAESVCKDLSPAQEHYLHKAFLAMVRIDEGGHYVRKPVRWVDLPENVHGLLDRFVKARLLVSRGEGADRILEVAHEALFRSWERLAGWLNLDREFLQWRQRLHSAFAEWKRTERDAGSLLRGSILIEAEKWLADRRADLSADEQSFIDQGVAERDREKVAREQRRRRALAFISGALAVTVVLAALLAWQWKMAKLQGQVALARQWTAQAQMLLHGQPEQLEGTVLLAVESMRRLPSLETYQVLHRGLALLPQRISEAFHQKRITDVSFSQDGGRVATASSDHSAAIWEVQSGRELAGFAHQAEVNSVVFSPNGAWLATASDDRTARIWNALTGEELFRLRHDNDVRKAVFSPDGKYLATASEDKTAKLWEAETGKLVKSISHDRVVTTVVFSPDSRYLASGSGDVIEDMAARLRAQAQAAGKPETAMISPGVAHIWDVVKNHEVSQLLHGLGVSDIAFSPDSRYLATAGTDRVARVWDLTTGKEISRNTHEDSVRNIAFSPNGKFVASVSAPGFMFTSAKNSVKVWEAVSGQGIAQFVHEGAIYDVDFSPNSRFIVTASGDGTARVFEPARQREVARLTHPNAVYTVAFNPKGHLIAAGGMNGEVRIWELASGAEAFGLALNWGTEMPMLSPDGQYFAVSIPEKTVQVWKVGAAQASVTLVFDSPAAFKHSFSVDGRYLTTTHADGTARLWDVATGQELDRKTMPQGHIHAVPSARGPSWAVSAEDEASIAIVDISGRRKRVVVRHDGTIRTLNLSANADLLATGGEDKAVRVWTTKDGREVVRMNHDSAVQWLSFSPDQSLLSVATEKGVHVYNLTSGRQVTQIKQSYVIAAPLSPDNNYLALVREVDKSVRLWDLSIEREIGVISHAESLNQVAFTSDGRYLVTTIGELFSRRHTVQRWLWRPDDLIAEACKRLTRNLSQSEWAQYVGGAYKSTCPNIPIDLNDALQHAGSLAQSGDQKRAKTAYGQATAWALERADSLASNQICWLGSIDGFASTVLPACNNAVNTAPTEQIPWYRDSRGLARALVGDRDRAVEDFVAFVESLRGRPTLEAHRKRRETWISELKAGRNPFSEENLQSLRSEHIR